jgi:hypothetical protein
MRIQRRTMLLGVLTTALAGARRTNAEAGARPTVTVHRSPT